MYRFRPIRNDDDHALALGRIETLWGSASGSLEGEELELLATLVEAYERNRWPDAEVDAIDVLRLVMDERGLSSADLSRVLESRSRASEILARKRALTVEMIWKISRAWDIPADLLVKPYRIGNAA